MAKGQDHDIHGQSSIQARPLHLQRVVAAVLLNAVDLATLL